MLFVGQGKVITSPPYLVRGFALKSFCASVQNNRIVLLKAIKSPQVFPNLDAMQTCLDLWHSLTVIENLK